MRCLILSSVCLFWAFWLSVESSTPAAGGAPFSDLPPGWSEHSWEGRPYYYNHIDGTSSWVHPSKLSQQQPIPQSPMASAPSGQQEGQDGLGSQVSQASSTTEISDSLEYPTEFTSSPIQEAEIHPATQEPSQFYNANTFHSQIPQTSQSPESGVLQNRLYHLEEETQRLNEALTEALQTKEQAELELDRTQQKFKAVAKQADEAEERIELVQSSLDELQAENQELMAEGTLHLALQRNLTGKVEALETTKLKLEMQVFNLTTLYEATLDELNSLKSEESSYEEELQNALAKKAELEGLLEDALDEVAALDKERRQLTRWVQSSKRPSIFKRLFEDYVVGMVPESLRKPSPVELELKEMNKTIENLQSNNSLLAGMLESKDELIDELNERVDVFEHSAVKRKKKFKQLKEEITELTNTLMQKDEEIERYKEEVNEYYFQAAELNETVVELQEKLDVMIDDNILMEEKIVDLTAKAAAEENISGGHLVTIDNLGKLLEQRLDTIDFLNASLQNATSQLQEVQRNASALALELDRQILANKVIVEEHSKTKKMNSHQLPQRPPQKHDQSLHMAFGLNLTSNEPEPTANSNSSKPKKKWFCCF